MIKPEDFEHVKLDNGAFVWAPPKSPPLLTNEEHRQLTAVLVARGMEQGDADMSLHFMVPTLLEIVKRHCAASYDIGERNGISRANSRPGNGDMGG